MSDTRSLTEREITAIGKALADPRRFSILSELAETGLLCCQAMRKEHPVSAATISHHMKELEAAGLVEILRDGKFASLRIRRETIDLYLDTLRRILATPLESPDR